MKKSENIISNALKLHADAIEASPVMKEKIDQAILKQNTVFKKERSTSMKWNFKKVAVAALGVCLLTGGVCYAAEQMTQLFYISSAVPSDYQTDFSAVDSCAKEAGLDVNALESFANGYTFAEVGVDNTAAIGEEDQKLYEFSELVLRYEKEGLPSISIFAEDAVYDAGFNEELIYDAVRECDGIEIKCYTVTNKFVPTEDDLTDEDRANMDNPNYNFACGTDEVEIRQSMHVNWIKDGVRYHMFGFDLPLSAEEMLDMAEEMIRAE